MNSHGHIVDQDLGSPNLTYRGAYVEVGALHESENVGRLLIFQNANQVTQRERLLTVVQKQQIGEAVSPKSYRRRSGGPEELTFVHLAQAFPSLRSFVL